MRRGAIPGAGCLGIALLLAVGLVPPAGATKLHLRDSVLAVECHWVRSDGLIVIRNGVAMRVPHEDVVEVELEDPPAPAGACPALAPEPLLTLGASAPPSPGPAPPPALAPPAPALPEERALTEDQRRHLAQLRALASATARAYRMPAPVGISVMALASTNLESLAGVGIAYTPGRLWVDPGLLGAWYADALVARTLAYELLPPVVQAASMADYERRQRQRDLDANAKAVEILARARAWPERVALQAVYEWLAATHRAVVAGQVRLRGGQPEPCDQIRDLLGRFPAERGWTASLECAPRSGGGSGRVRPA
jgi:hypothetical protein